VLALGIKSRFFNTPGCPPDSRGEIEDVLEQISWKLPKRRAVPDAGVQGHCQLREENGLASVTNRYAMAEIGREPVKRRLDWYAFLFKELRVVNMKSEQFLWLASCRASSVILHVHICLYF
jgi:hypothetical protein